MAEAAPVYHPPFLLSPSSWRAVVEGRAVLPRGAEPDPDVWTHLEGPVWRFKVTAKGLWQPSNYYTHAADATKAAGAVAWRIDRTEITAEADGEDGSVSLPPSNPAGVIVVRGGVASHVLSLTSRQASATVEAFMRYAAAVETDGAWLDLGPWEVDDEGIHRARVFVERELSVAAQP